MAFVQTEAAQLAEGQVVKHFDNLEEVNLLFWDHFFIKTFSTLAAFW